MPESKTPTGRASIASILRRSLYGVLTACSFAARRSPGTSLHDYLFVRRQEVTMKRSTRLALSVYAVVGALAAAGSAAAVPRLTVGTPHAKLALGGSTVAIHFTEEQTDAAPAKLAVYAPE